MMMSCRPTVMFERPCVFLGCACGYDLTKKKKSQRDFVIVVWDGRMQVHTTCASIFCFWFPGSSWNRKKGVHVVYVYSWFKTSCVAAHHHHPIIRVRRLACSPQYQYIYIYVCVCVREREREREGTRLHIFFGTKG